ncbi:hypothetical protein [Enterococcus gilvus]|nr:hypothetical protein [Enterococcus gilvus]
MSDLIYNSGHYYIDDPSLRYWLIDNTYKFRDMLPVELNSNQQIVLEWLKSNSNALKVPMLAIYELAELADEKVRAAYRQLNREEEFQVLAAFAEWGMKEVAE